MDAPASQPLPDPKWPLVTEVLVQGHVPTARVLGGLSDQARGSGHASGFADLAIAATALVHGYTVLTRNLRHFRLLAVLSHDPFESLPGRVSHR